MHGLHIAVDALFRLPEGGARTHLEQTLTVWGKMASETEDRITVFTTPKGAAAFRGVARDSDAVALHVYRWPGRSVIRRIVWEQFALPRVIRQNGPDVLLCPGNMSPLAIVTPVVVMMRTMAPFCQDVTARARLVGQFMRLSARRATHVICVSEAMRDLVVNRFGIEPSRTTVIQHGLDQPLTGIQEDSASPYPFPFLVSVGGIRRYKNLAELIEGYALLLRTLPDCPWRLVIVGHVHNQAYADSLHAVVERLQLSQRVIFAGGIPHAKIPALLKGAVALVHSSTCESFGLPLLEAMTAGVPIACSHIPASVEVAGDAALTFDPDDPADIAAQLAQLSDPLARQDLIARGQARLTTFRTWADVAAQTRAVLWQVANLSL